MRRIEKKKKVTSREVLIIGFERTFHVLLNDFQDLGAYTCNIINDPGTSLDWPNMHIGPKPFAILCSYEFLELQNFELLRTLRNDLRFAGVPFVTISHKPISLSTSEALSIGLDDNFIKPIDWKVLHHRLKFLERFKKIKRPVSGKTSVTLNPVKVALHKRIFDIALSLSAIIVLSPILVLIALIIKMESSGPAIFVSQRIGANYKAFNFLKFRTMEVCEKSNIHDLASDNIYDSKDPLFHKIKNDPRVTRIGKFLRKTSLDEIPQLINVIKGDMSIVGNRPLPLYEAQKLTTNQYAMRFFAPAGITGLWQVAPEGKENVSQDQRIQFDIEYAKRNSFVLDLKIIARTIPAMLQKGE